jgi:hypothetical protein
VNRSSRHISVRRIFAAPAILAVLSAAGLTSALLGDGAWDVVSWIALAAPIAVPLYFVLRTGAH